VTNKEYKPPCHFHKKYRPPIRPSGDCKLCWNAYFGHKADRIRETEYLIGAHGLEQLAALVGPIYMKHFLRYKETYDPNRNSN
jgi:hypothetical protein